MKYKIKNIITATLVWSSILAVNSTKAVANETNNNAITVTIEAPTIQSSQLPNPAEYYVIDFNDLSGTGGFSKTNNTTTYTYSNDLEVKSANQWGGANGSQFITQAELESARSYSININKDQKYFGFWWSAGDPYNVITFKNNGEDVAFFKTSDLVYFINNSGVVNTSSYKGNPAYSGNDIGHLNEPFSFVNVFFNDSNAYDEIIVTTMAVDSAAFESDNHTFSAISQTPRGQALPEVILFAD